MWQQLSLVSVDTLLMDYGWNVSGSGGGLAMTWKMTLHIGEREFILFDFWKTGSLTGLCASMLIIFLMCILYEAIKALRQFLTKVERYNRQQRRLQQRHSGSTAASSDHSRREQQQPPAGVVTRLNPSLIPSCPMSRSHPADSMPNVVHSSPYHHNVITTDNISMDSLTFAPLLRMSGATGSVFTQYRVIQCLLYACQITLSYILIMVVMTFNLWLLLAVIVGEAVGYLLFSGEPSSEECFYDNEVSSECR